MSGDRVSSGEPAQRGLANDWVMADPVMSKRNNALNEFRAGSLYPQKPMELWSQVDTVTIAQIQRLLQIRLEIS